MRKSRDSALLGQTASTEHLPARVAMQDGGPDAELEAACVALGGLRVGLPVQRHAAVVPLLRDPLVHGPEQLGSEVRRPDGLADLAAQLPDARTAQHEGQALVEALLGEIRQQHGRSRLQAQAAEAPGPEQLLAVGRKEHVGDACDEAAVEQGGPAEMDHGSALVEHGRKHWKVGHEYTLQWRRSSR